MRSHRRGVRRAMPVLGRNRRARATIRNTRNKGPFLRSGNAGFLKRVRPWLIQVNHRARFRPIHRIRAFMVRFIECLLSVLAPRPMSSTHLRCLRFRPATCRHIWRILQLRRKGPVYILYKRLIRLVLREEIPPLLVVTGGAVHGLEQLLVELPHAERTRKDVPAAGTPANPRVM
eukprot:gene165-biopygen47